MKKIEISLYLNIDVTFLAKILLANTLIVLAKANSKTNINIFELIILFVLLLSYSKTSYSNI